jgi:hypothetical protein
MKFRMLTFLTVLSIALSTGNFTIAAESKIKKQLVPADTSLQMEGQIFIVTKGQQAIKLALVPVSIVSEDDLKVFLSTKANQANLARRDLAPTLKKLQEEKEASYSNLNPFLEKILILSSEASSEDRKCSELGYMEAYKCRRSTELANKQKEVDSLRHNAKPIREKYEEADKAHNATKVNYEKLIKANVFLSGMEDIPQLGNAKTDADGKFNVTVSVPAGKKVVVIAKANRQIVGEKEEYRWMLWISPEKGQSKASITLANDNLLETICSNCLNYLPLIEINDIGSTK